MATVGATTSVLIGTNLLPNGQSRVSIYCDTVRNGFYQVDDDGNETWINGYVTATTTQPNATATASYGATNSFYGTTTAILAKPDKWLTIVQGTQSYLVPGYYQG